MGLPPRPSGCSLALSARLSRGSRHRAENKEISDALTRDRRAEILLADRSPDLSFLLPLSHVYKVHI